MAHLILTIILEIITIITSDVYMWKVRLSDLLMVIKLISDKIGMH